MKRIYGDDSIMEGFIAEHWQSITSRFSYVTVAIEKSRDIDSKRP